MSLINCEISLILNWSANCVISSAAANQATTFAITNTRRGGRGGRARPPVTDIPFENLSNSRLLSQ